MDNVANSRAYEMNIEDFAAAIPMKMDYIIMDACLMGGIEVAYALKDKCDRIIFSQAEVIGDGLCEYDTMASRLLAGGSIWASARIRTSIMPPRGPASLIRLFQ